MPVSEIQRLMKLGTTLPLLPLPKQAELLAADSDVVLFGGAVGGSKSTGLALKAVMHPGKSLLLRRTFRELQSLQDTIAGMLGRDSYHAGRQEWDTPGSGKIMMGSCPNLGDEGKFQGIERSLLGIDEAAAFEESQIQFLRAWVRSPDPDQKCQLVMCSNPPVSGQARWLAVWFAPWVNPSYPRPAESGEVRYFVTKKGQSIEVAGPAPVEMDGTWLIPESRVFIKSGLIDNQYLTRTGYGDRLTHLPEDLQAALLHGDFMFAGQDNLLQAVPSRWIRAAMDRWTPLEEKEKPPLTAVGLDVSRGGADRTAVFFRHGSWFDKPVVLQGKDTDSGSKVATVVMELLKGRRVPVYTDVIGIGASAHDFLEGYLGPLAHPVNVAESSKARDQSGASKYFNKRSELWWSFRQRLNPETSRIAIPPDTGLFSELAAPTYQLSGSGIRIEGKEQLIRRLHRSTDLADALLLACQGGGGTVVREFRVKRSI